MTTSKPLSQRALGAAVDTICGAALKTPTAVGLALGRALGSLLCRLDGRHRRIARANLRFAFRDEASAERIEELVHRNFQQWGMIAYEWMRMRDLAYLPPDRLRLPVEVSGARHLSEARRRNQAVLLLSAHFGNWEYGHLHYAATINRLSFIVRRIDNPILEQKRVAYNQQHGVTILYKENGLKTAVRHLKKGRDLVIFADQKANIKEGIPCRLFGRPTTTLPIVASLARKYDLPVVPMFTVRKPSGNAHRLVFLPALAISAQDSLECISQRQNDVIEQMIRRYPDHWLWMHRKWKTEHPELYRGC